MVYKFFDKKSKGSGFKSEAMLNQELPEELHEPVIGKFEKRKVYSSFKLFKKLFRFLLCAIDIYSKYA